LAPTLVEGFGKFICAIFATVFTVRANEIGVAKLTNCVGSVFFSPRPKVATCKTAKDCWTPRKRTFSLNRFVDFLY
jgi:hypothetical protein